MSARERCDRCGAPLETYSMSYFNLDLICPACGADEREAPGFAAAREAETAALRAGDYNFPGVGLSDVDRTFLAERRASRGGAS